MTRTWTGRRHGYNVLRAPVQYCVTVSSMWMYRMMVHFTLKSVVEEIIAVHTLLCLLKTNSGVTLWLSNELSLNWSRVILAILTCSRGCSYVVISNSSYPTHSTFKIDVGSFSCETTKRSESSIVAIWCRAHYTWHLMRSIVIYSVAYPSADTTSEALRLKVVLVFCHASDRKTNTAGCVTANRTNTTLRLRYCSHTRV